MHVPKTVDNDLAVTDNCPGFGSVAKYVATSMREAAFDVASMAKTSTKVFVLEVMGRHAGWITAAVGMADDAETPIPLVLLFPEIPFDEAKFLAAVDAKVKRYRLLLRRRVGGALPNAQGKLMAEAGTRDAFGHAQLGGVGPLIASIVKDKLSYKYHWAVADYLQRAARHLASKTDLEHSVRGRQGGGGDGARGPQCGDAGDHARLRQAVPLEDHRGAARRRSPTSRRCCRAISSRPTATASPPRRARYLAPLMRGEAPPPFKDGLPQYVRLKNVAVPKKLATEFKV